MAGTLEKASKICLKRTLTAAGVCVIGLTAPRGNRSKLNIRMPDIFAKPAKISPSGAAQEHRWPLTLKSYKHFTTTVRKGSPERGC